MNRFGLFARRSFVLLRRSEQQVVSSGGAAQEKSLACKVNAVLSEYIAKDLPNLKTNAKAEWKELYGKYKNIENWTVGDLKKFAYYNSLFLSFFFIGEIIGRKNVIGYDV
eukprot:TRINITY_DN7232_c0_g1_i1.p1 TRINITY_DN7232_c0_g1~~TRINITY_DN7232_c0_g1_i1.p1  ORF type:complete len:110 (+),score=21.39 TRINITY_DN7232_c0_g1_i1:90-419(+)